MRKISRDYLLLFCFLQQIQEVCTIAQQHGDAMPANQLFLPQGAQQENHTGSNGDHGIDAEIGGEGHRNDELVEQSLPTIKLQGIEKKGN